MPLVLDVKIPREEEFEGVDAQNGHDKSLSLFFFFNPLFLFFFRLREESESPCLGKHGRQSLKARLAVVLLPHRPLFFHY